MKQSINFYQFQDAFERMGRGTQFSYEALDALFLYLQHFEECLKEETELDVVALCCEYQEIEDDEEAYKEYVGEDATREDYIIAHWPNSILVRVG